MNTARYVEPEYSATNAGKRLMIKLLLTVVSAALVGAMLYIPASAQNPCAEMGPDCRVLTGAEIKAFKTLVLSVKALLPVPDTAAYQPDGAIEASTMPFVALTKIAGAPYTGGSWPSGCFPIYPYNSLSFGYDAKARQKKSTDMADDPLAAVEGMMAGLGSKIELGVSLKPHAYLMNAEEGKSVEEVPDQEAYNIEKSAGFLTWQTGDDYVALNMIFGPRTINEEETLTADQPSPKFAPIRSIELIISGPKKEVAALRKKIDRRAFAALLGPVVK